MPKEAGNPQHLFSTSDDFRDFFKVTKEKEEASLEEVAAATLRIVKECIENQKITIETDLPAEMMRLYKKL